MKSIIVACLVVALSTPVLAQDAVPLMRGEKAPSNGMLVSEIRLKKFLNAEIAVDNLEAQLRVQERLTNNLETLYSERLKEASKQNSSDNKWLYFAGGILTAILLGYGANQLR